MHGKILNVPNTISFIRGTVIVPLAAFLLLNGYLVEAFIACAAFIILDGVDGYIARKFKQVTNLGVYLDAISDNLLLAVLSLCLVYLGYINFLIIALLIAHRFTRLFLTIYIKFYTKGFYIPKHIKATGTIPLIYICLIPFTFNYFGKTNTDIITYLIIGIAYVTLVVETLVALQRFKEGKLVIEHLERVEIKKIVKNRARRAKTTSKKFLKKNFQKINPGIF